MVTETLTDPVYLTITEVARTLRQSRATVYRKVTTGELEAFRLGEAGPLRIRVSALEAHLRPRPVTRPETFREGPAECAPRGPLAGQSSRARTGGGDNHTNVGG
jgi:excisionase family DNA binding protein